MKWGQGLPSQEGGFEDTPGGLSRLCRGLLVQGGRAWRWVDWRGSLLPSNSHILPQVCGWRKDVSTGTWRELPDTLPDLGGLAFRVISGRLQSPSLWDVFLAPAHGVCPRVCVSV